MQYHALLISFARSENGKEASFTVVIVPVNVIESDVDAIHSGLGTINTSLHVTRKCSGNV